MYQIRLSTQAQKDKAKLKAAGLAEKARSLLALLIENPYQTPPPYEKLIGDLLGRYSRRINIQHRLVYEVDEAEKVVRILRMWTHYDK